MIISSTRTFQPGQTDQECMPVSIVNDDIPEEDEIFTVTLSSNDIPNPISAAVTITDDDGILMIDLYFIAHWLSFCVNFFRFGGVWI